ncbi:MAG: hypothetical protein ABSH28_09780 [Acidobacteriota bacterium]|jgi:hypothetical protein
MSIPTYLSSTFRYKETLAVVDVQTIINDLYVELVTNGGWTCTVGGSGQTPTTFKSPARADGLFLTIQCTRTSATRIAYVVRDHNGMLVNNQTDTRQDIDVAGSTVHYFTGPFHFCVNTERATPECFYCGLADQTPEPISIPRPTYFASYGPRDTSGTWVVNGYWSYLYIMSMGATSYVGNASRAILRACTDSFLRKTMSGALLCEPLELTDGAGIFMGRAYQAMIVDSSLAFAAEATIPLDDNNTGVFKVVGCIVTSNTKLAFRKA